MEIKEMETQISQPYHHGDLRRVLVDSALDMLQEFKSWQFTLREVARRAGVSHAAPYRHFPDKAALLSELAKVGFEKLRVQLSAALLDDLSVENQLTAAAKAYIDFGNANPALYHLMFSSEAGDTEEVHLNERAMATLNVLVTLLERGQKEGVFKRRPVQGHAATCWALVHGLTTLSMNGLLLSEKVGDKPIDSALRTLLEGLMADSIAT
jgi:AcrR family transcriptional regulator